MFVFFGKTLCVRGGWLEETRVVPVNTLKVLLHRGKAKKARTAKGLRNDALYTYESLSQRFHNPIEHHLGLDPYGESKIIPFSKFLKYHESVALFFVSKGTIVHAIKDLSNATIIYKQNSIATAHSITKVPEVIVTNVKTVAKKCKYYLKKHPFKKFPNHKNYQLYNNTCSLLIFELLRFSLKNFHDFNFSTALQNRIQPNLACSTDNSIRLLPCLYRTSIYVRSPPVV